MEGTVGEPARALILNVDDYAPGRYVRTQILRRAGFEVAEAASGTEGLARAFVEQPALVLLDVNLPDISGHEVCRRLKADPATAALPVIQLTATATATTERVTGLEAGADAYLTEPIDPRVLLATVNAMLRARQALADADAARRDAEAARADADRARADAEAANRDKDEFIAVVSHELRGPLNAIVGWLSMVRKVPNDPATAVRALDAVDRSVRSLTRLVDDLLEVSRFSRTKVELDMRRVDLAAVVAAALDAVRDAAVTKAVAIETRVDGELPAVVGDASRLQQVVWNLVSNAVKFTRPGGRVDVRLSCDPPVARIVVADTGVGIAPAFLPFVFDRFRQATRGASPSGGLGLGLAIVRHLVELHGGRVSAASEGEGRGATFTVTLPCEAD
jgi:signal transduction histidine kinase